MKPSTKTKVAIAAGMVLIVFVASLVGVPFMDSEPILQKTQQESIKKVEESEERMLDLISQEKTELEMKTGGKLKIP